MPEGPPPYYLVDRNAWDFAKYGPNDSIRFNVDLEEAVQGLWQEIERRGGDIWIAFFHKPMFQSGVATIVSLFEGGQTNYHAEVWFGDRVAVMAVAGRVGLLPWYFRLDSVKELVKLPFKNRELAFRVCVDTVRQAHGVAYSDHYMEMLGKTLHLPAGRDYDEERPGTWKGGVHCSQLTLLYIKRCVRHGAVELEGGARRALLQTHSATCLPCELRALLQAAFGARLETKIIGPEPVEEYLKCMDLWEDRRITPWLEDLGEEEESI